MGLKINLILNDGFYFKRLIKNQATWIEAYKVDVDNPAYPPSRGEYIDQIYIFYAWKTIRWEFMH